MSHNPRKAYTAEEKVAILRRYLLEQVPVSDLCDQHQLFTGSRLHVLRDLQESQEV